MCPNKALLLHNRIKEGLPTIQELVIWLNPTPLLATNHATGLGGVRLRGRGPALIPAMANASSILMTSTQAAPHTAIPTEMRRQPL